MLWKENSSGSQRKTTIRRRKTILIVDDEADIRDMIALALSVENCVVQVAENREHALQLIEKEPPQMVLLDYAIPGMTAKEFVRILRERHPSTEIVLMTAGFWAADKAQELGLKRFLSKPFETAELMRMVNECVVASSGS